MDHSYASSQEIKSYLSAVTFHYGIDKYISLRSQVTRAEWCELTSKWTVSVHGQGDFECEILVNACGILNNVQYPRIEGVDCFKGPLLHTAAWDENVDLGGKKVAIIGAGASAIQMLPVIAKVAGSCDVYIRTPSWIVPPAGGDKKGNFEYTKEDKERFQNDSEFSLSSRRKMESEFNSMYPAFMKDGEAQRALRTSLEQSMKGLLRDPALHDKLIPKFEVGCRRINPGEPYLEILQERHVRPIFEPIDKITSDGVVSGGETRRADIIITATGFDTSFTPRFPIIGREGRDLRELWQTDPISYFGLAVAGFPNYFMFLGPNTPISNGSVMGTLEATSDYFVRLLGKLMREKASSVEVREEVQADFDAHTQDLMQDMVWTGPCRSWYKGDDGKVRALWPGSSLHYREVLACNRWEDFKWKYRGNRFAYWGEGLSQVETSVDASDGDFAYYMEQYAPLPLEAYYLAAKGWTTKNRVSKSFRKGCNEVVLGDESEGSMIEPPSVVSV
ncbi:uncharacterized protein N0V89_012591 [Didymosphaeria variabile]|uniref:Monooxygenase n=1 Tax=Didymosphaeria variabile TaxID=1932322 RepID=A0A9W9C571_9PLEO|nr:uncharacterized protein N0V89_012591 [Didymosphaeria variabile]KAJ4344847.1 hypothetical protein N0V89_012591 [Didymosphaeria variabile]